MWERHPWPGTAARPLLGFRNIDTVCTQVGREWLEFIMRLDPRINWDDIDMRMEHDGARVTSGEPICFAHRAKHSATFIAPNLEGGTMSTFQSASLVSPEPPKKKINEQLLKHGL